MQNPLASLTHRERFGLAVFASALVLFGVGSALYHPAAAPLEPLVRTTPSPLPSLTPAPNPAPLPELVVYVTGAVKKPGIYRFPSGTRLYQAVQKAGGFRKSAQQEALNLAAPLKDAQQVHVPTQGAPSLAPVTALAPLASTPHESSTTVKKLHTPGEGKVALNAATLEELQRLPGIGPSMAQRILDYRQQNGQFQELAQLREVKGIGEKTFAKLEPFLSL